MIIIKIYQPQKNNPYRLPQNLYMQTVYLIRDYDRLQNEYDELVGQSPDPSDGQPRGTNCSDPTAKEGIELAYISEKLKAVEQAQILIPEEYRKGILNNIMYLTPYPDYASRNTWSAYRCRFVHNVAKNMYWK